MILGSGRVHLTRSFGGNDLIFWQHVAKMYYVLTIYFDDRTETYCRENDCVYSRTEYHVRKGRLCGDEPIPEGFFPEWSYRRPLGFPMPGFIILSNGTVDAVQFDDITMTPLDGDVDMDELKIAINQLAPTQHLDIQPLSEGVIVEGRRSLVIDCHGMAWLIDHDYGTGGYSLPRHVPTTHPAVCSARVDYFTVIIIGLVSWKVGLHEKLPEKLREVFRTILLSFLKLKGNFPLFYRVGELI